MKSNDSPEIPDGGGGGGHKHPQPPLGGGGRGRQGDKKRGRRDFLVKDDHTNGWRSTNEQSFLQVYSVRHDGFTRAALLPAKRMMGGDPGWTACLMHFSRA